MPQYKDIDAILNNLPNDLPYKASVKRVLIQAPEADVVPKSEVDKWYHEYHVIKDELKQEKMYHRETEKLADRYCIELQKAKADVAREIFEEIEKGIAELYPIIYAPTLNKFLAELKKKYTEGNNEES